jgi:hypothetical protein
VNILGVNIKPWLLAVITLSVSFVAFSFIGLSQAGRMTMLSEKDLVAYWEEIEPENIRPLYYLNYQPVSSNFYSDGKAVKIDSGFKDLMGHGFWLAVHKTQGDASAWNCSLKFQPQRGIFDIYLCNEHQE